MNELEITSLKICYGELTAVEDVSFKVESGEICCLVGPSGCGKSSILESIVGNMQPESGSVRSSQTTRYGYVTQRDSLLPWKSAISNVAFPLILSGTDEQTAKMESRAWLKKFEVDMFADSYPDELSGGMRSRISIARALVNNPDVLVMDECFASIDELTRERLWVDLHPVWKSMNATIVLVTHSIAEAVFLADKVVVLSNRPATVKEIVLNEDARNREYLTSESFFLKCNEVRKVIEEIDCNQVKSVL